MPANKTWERSLLWFYIEFAARAEEARKRRRLEVQKKRQNDLLRFAMFLLRSCKAEKQNGPEEIVFHSRVAQEKEHEVLRHPESSFGSVFLFVTGFPRQQGGDYGGKAWQAAKRLKCASTFFRGAATQTGYCIRYQVVNRSKPYNTSK